MQAPSHTPTAAPGTDTTPVVVRFGAMGDMVLLTVLLQALAQRFAGPVDLLSSGGWTQPLLGHDPNVRRLHIITSRKRPYWLTPSQWSAVAWLRAHAGPVLLCDADEASARLLQRAGIPQDRILRAWDHRPGGEVHWADWWAQIAQLDPPGLPGPPPAPKDAVSRQPRITIGPDWVDGARPWLHSLGLLGPTLVLMQPGNKKTHRRGKLATAYSDKHWDAAQWGELARGMAQHLAATHRELVIGVCGSEAEAGVAEDVVSAAGALPAGARMLNLARHQLTLPRLAVLASRAHSMVSVDTGPAHLAAALDCPLVVLYGSAGWGNWKPRAPNADVVPLGSRTPDPKARVDALTAEAVLQSWRQLRGRLPGHDRHRAEPGAPAGDAPAASRSEAP